MVTRIAPEPLPQVEIENVDSFGTPFGVAAFFDFREGDFVLHNGNLVISDEVRAIMQWITNTIIVEKNIFPIYDPDYGTYVYNLTGKGFPKEALVIMIPDMIEEELLKDSRISSVGNFNIAVLDNSMFVNFDVELVNGNIFNFEDTWVI